MSRPRPFARESRIDLLHGMIVAYFRHNHDGEKTAICASQIGVWTEGRIFVMPADLDDFRLAFEKAAAQHHELRLDHPALSEDDAERVARQRLAVAA